MGRRLQVFKGVMETGLCDVHAPLYGGGINNTSEVKSLKTLLSINLVTEQR